MTPTQTQTFSVIGKPLAKGRPRFSRIGNFVKTYTPEKTLNWEAVVRETYIAKCGKPPEEYGMVYISVVAYFGIPKSWPKWKKEYAKHFRLECPQHSDFDNLVKLIGDALNGVAYRDDAMVVAGHIWKFHSSTPRTTIRLDYLPEVTKEYALDKLKEVDNVRTNP